jgi:hypothetical protein
MFNSPANILNLTRNSVELDFQFTLIAYLEPYNRISPERPGRGKAVKV